MSPHGRARLTDGQINAPLIASWQTLPTDLSILALLSKTPQQTLPLVPTIGLSTLHTSFAKLLPCWSFIIYWANPNLVVFPVYACRWTFYFQKYCQK